MKELRDAKILVTGPAGQIAFPLAARLAKENEVWGIARFSDSRTQERCDKAGMQTRAVDLAEPNWGDLPDDFSYVLHLAATIAPGHDFDNAIRINAEGTGRLMLRPPLEAGPDSAVGLGLGRVAALRDRPSTSHRIR